jgi:predicted NUDIX family NTP pyrophosphohydrolase
MARVSAGLVMVNPTGQVLLVHPGGPFFRRREYGVWSIPKGLVEPGESLLDAARREFCEELGFGPANEGLEPLGSIRQGGGKRVHAWAFEGSWDTRNLQSMEFDLEWPPRSGIWKRFPEADRAEFFGPEEARQRIVEAQWPLVERALLWHHSGHQPVMIGEHELTEHELAERAMPEHAAPEHEPAEREQSSNE